MLLADGDVRVELDGMVALLFSVEELVVGMKVYFEIYCFILWINEKVSRLQRQSFVNTTLFHVVRWTKKFTLLLNFLLFKTSVLLGTAWEFF